MINRVILVGRFTKDPGDLRRSSNGNAVVSFTIAVDNRFSKQEDRSADFINCVVWNKTAEFVSQYCRKGALVGVEGRIQSRSYEDKEGKRVYVTEVVCDSVQLLESKAVSSQRKDTTYEDNFAQDKGPKFEDNLKDPSIDIEDDDLPF
jgi:single-strand DNA-binding protein